MFVSFNDTFNKKPQEQNRVPAVFIDYLNRSVPSGVRYEADDNGNCIITGENESFKLGGFVPVLTAEQMRVLGDGCTQEDIIRYFYNMQKPIPLKLKKDGCVILNDTEFPIEKMSYNPLVPIKYVSKSIMLYPPKFPKPFPVEVGCGRYSRVLTVKRIPNDSPSVAVFESDSREPLCIKLYIDEKKRTMNINLSYDLKKADSVRDIVESMAIYNAYIDGNGLLLGHKLSYRNTGSDIRRFNNGRIAFWERVLEVEEYLGVRFVPSADDIDADTLFAAEQLYMNLIEKVPIRDRYVISSLDIRLGSESEADKIRKLVGRPMPFEYGTKLDIELFGVKLKLPAIVVICGAVLSDVSHGVETQKLTLADESPEKRRSTSVMCFRTESELEAYKNRSRDSMTERFKNAKRPEEYLT